ncbi:MAG: DEAD/DEAH box helicase family protein [Methylophilaceae bacterium]
MTSNKAPLKVNVVDSIMGSGKTTWVIDKINQEENPKFIYVTPTLTEVERIKTNCPDADFKEPESKEHGSKYFNFKKLVCAGENIATTHSLFRFLTREILDELTSQQYTLIIDEALDCVEIYTDITKSDLTILLDDGLVNVEPNSYRLRWNEKEHDSYKGKFDRIRTLCNNGNLVYYKEKTMLWEFPVEFLRVFKDIHVLTYLFQGSAMANYLRADETNIVMHTLQGKASKDIVPTLAPYNQLNEIEIKDVLRPLITIYEGSSNKIGDKTGRENPLSSSWYKRATPVKLKALKSGLNNFFNGKLKSKSQDNAWTTFKTYKTKLSGKGYVKGFLPNNTKATNEHVEKKVAAYTCNTFYHPVIRNYFNERGVTVYEDIYALSEMVQFLWRFQIRRYNPVNLYIPSERMRSLLKTWLAANSANDLFNGLGYDSPLENT